MKTSKTSWIQLKNFMYVSCVWEETYMHTPANQERKNQNVKSALRRWRSLLFFEANNKDEVKKTHRLPGNTQLACHTSNLKATKNTDKWTATLGKEGNTLRVSSFITSTTFQLLDEEWNWTLRSHMRPPQAHTFGTFLMTVRLSGTHKKKTVTIETTPVFVMSRPTNNHYGGRHWAISPNTNRSFPTNAVLASTRKKEKQVEMHSGTRTTDESDKRRLVHKRGRMCCAVSPSIGGSCN